MTWQCLKTAEGSLKHQAIPAFAGPNYRTLEHHQIRTKLDKQKHWKRAWEDTELVI